MSSRACFICALSNNEDSPAVQALIGMIHENVLPIMSPIEF